MTGRTISRRRKARRGTGAAPNPQAAGSGFSGVYAVVAMIPRGHVATYGQVAALAGRPGQGRQVGYALAALRAGSDVPWHRVVNARGEISLRRESGASALQRALLEREKVRFDVAGRIPLERYRWSP